MLSIPFWIKSGGQDVLFAVTGAVSPRDEKMTAGTGVVSHANKSVARQLTQAQGGRDWSILYINIMALISFARSVSNISAQVSSLLSRRQ